MEKTPLKKWVIQLQKGNQSAFDVIYTHTHRLVFSVALHYIKDVSLAKDVVQDTYLQFLNNLPQINLHLSLPNYLITIAKNLSLNVVKKRSKEVIEDFEDKEFHYAQLRQEDSHEWDTPIMDAAKKHLNQEDFYLLLLIAVAGYKRREVASLLNQPLSTITWRYNQIIKQMQAIIQKEGLA